LKRSNRLILLIGLFLAVVAFVGIVLIFNQPATPGGGGGGVPTELPTVYAKESIPLGTKITPENKDLLLETRTVKVTERDATAFPSVDILIGRTIRQDVGKGAQLTAAAFSTGRGTGLVTVDVPATQRAIAVQVDQVSGVGTLINTGDYVDLVVGITGDRFPVITIDPESDQITPVPGLNGTSVKILIQGLQVLGALLPPTPQQQGQEGQPAEGEPGTTLTGQQEIVILSVTAQQAELIKFAQMDGSITLVLRSSSDFRDPLDPTKVIIPDIAPTSGVILKTLVDEYGVLPPQLIETVLPARARP
jgi:pilus assembly protein CpaB